MVHDKNPGEITEECPLRYFQRLKQELFDVSDGATPTPLVCIFSETNATPNDILELMKEEYIDQQLDSITKWCPGSIPKAYCNVKEKDNNKSRLISASHNAPIRKLLQLTSKALTYLLRTLPKEVIHFTLHSLQTLIQIYQRTVIYFQSTSKDSHNTNRRGKNVH